MDELSDSRIDWFKQRPQVITLVLLGILLVTSGFIFLSASKVSNNDQLEIELIKADEDTDQLFVDIGGAVINPGVYQLAPSARVNDALVAAGGLSEDADRDWVTQTLNLAAKVSDGDKIYIPKLGESQVESESSSVSQGKINVNTASSSQLDTLWGVGPATAEKIISKRPYAKVEELLSKKAVNSNVYESIKDKVSVF